MRKINLAILLMFLFASPVKAASVSIVQLPEYTTSNSFKLSCSALGGTSAQFSFMKEGGSYADFGGAIDLTVNQCQVQVTSSQIDEQTKYYFKVIVNGTDSAETSTFYDISGPSGVSNYYKERINDGLYKLHFRTPGDSDFSKVVIYRGDSADFSADGGHEIARVSGGANSDMTYDDSFAPDAGKTYFYAIRALDKAGNSSSLVGDAGTTTVVASPAPGSVAGTSSAGSGSGSVNTLPVEEGGQILGEEATPTSEAAATESLPAESGGLSTAQKLGIGLGILAVLGAFYFFAKRRKS